MKPTLLPLFCGLLLGLSAQAQTAPPVLGAPPAPVAQPAAPATSAGEPFLLGNRYRVETVQGTVFVGTLVSLSLTALEFDASELGRVTLEPSQIRRATLAAPEVGLKTKPGYYDIGNGNRLFFAPTGRGLRKDEATLQDVDVYKVGINYGLTNNFSLGGYLSVIPGLSLTDQLLVLTPKLSFPVSDKVHVGAGVLYVRVPYAGSGDRALGAGIGYGVVTYGSADNNLTFGLGYGFIEGEIGSTPILQIGGQTRVSRRISLISENYIVADSKAGMGGLYGLKINWRRTSLGLGAAYFYTFGHDEEQPNYYYNPTTGQYTYSTQKVRVGGTGFSTYVLPVYYDFTFRFGKGVKR